MKTIGLVVAVVAAVAAAGFAWQRNQALEETRVALAGANTQLQKTQAELKSVTAEIAPLRKESAEQKTAIEQQRAELNTAKLFLDSERTSTARLREELTMAKEQIAFIIKSRAAQSAPAAYPAPTLVRPPKPMVIRAAPQSGNAASAPGRAQ
jgi:septal ring factor EnvC (AmiA/AmiB activator)